MLDVTNALQNSPPTGRRFCGSHRSSQQDHDPPGYHPRAQLRRLQSCSEGREEEEEVEYACVWRL